MDHERRLLTSDEAADLLRLRPATLRAWRCRGAGPPYHKVGDRVRYSRRDLDAWLAKQRRGSTTPAAEGSQP